MSQSGDSEKKPPAGVFGGGAAVSETPDAPSDPPPAMPPMSMGDEAQIRPPPGADDVVLDEIASNASATTDRGSMPPPLGHSEGHDAWTLERMSRQSTIPPVRNSEVDRLRELSARTSSIQPDPGDGGALDLVDRSRPSVSLDLEGEMEELYALDDMTGALRVAELILGRDPDNAQAKRCASNARARLIRLYTSKLGSLEQQPVIALDEVELRWLGLDHRSGFLLSRVDGMSTLDDILEISGMPRLEALKGLSELLERGAIKFP